MEIERVIRVAIASHVALVDGKEYDGIGNVLKDVIPGLLDEYVFVRHSMEGGLASEVQYFTGTEISLTDKLKVIRKIPIMRYATEVFSTVRYFKKKPTDIFIGIDPLNALAGVILKKRGIVKKAIFYTPDYSTKRFSSSLLNRVYHWIDRYCVKNADEVWSVSPRITEVRRSMGLSDRKNILLPNVPPEKYSSLRGTVKDRYLLFTCGIVDTQIDFSGVISAVSRLKDEMPSLRFMIVGNGPEEEGLKRLARSLGVEGRIIFKGRLTLAETLAETAAAGIGLALYTGEWGFNEFGDSTKSREFANFGVPIISTDTHATVPEIMRFGAGLIVDQSIDAYIDAIRDILRGYDNYSASSQAMGLAHSGAHRRVLQAILDK